MLFEMFRHFITTLSPLRAPFTSLSDAASLNSQGLATLKKQTLERPADRKAERPLRLEIVQAPWIVLQLQDRRSNLVEPDIRRQSPRQQSNRQTVGTQLFADLARIQIIRRSNHLRMQSVDVVSVVDPERRLNDWQLNDKLDPRRAA